MIVRQDKTTIGQAQVVLHSYPPDKGGKGGYIRYNKTLTQKARENRRPRCLIFPVVRCVRIDGT